MKKKRVRKVTPAVDIDLINLELRRHEALNALWQFAQSLDPPDIERIMNSCVFTGNQFRYFHNLLSAFIDYRDIKPL